MLLNDSRTFRSSASPINIRKNIKSSAPVVKIAAGGYHNLVKCMIVKRCFWKYMLF